MRSGLRWGKKTDRRSERWDCGDVRSSIAPYFWPSTWPHATYVLYKRTVFKPVGFELIFDFGRLIGGFGAKGSYSQLWYISSGAQYVTLQKYFSHPSLVPFYFLVTPPMKLKLLGGVLLITNHLDQSLWWANQKYWVPNQIVCITLLFCSWTPLLRLAFYQPPQSARLCWAKTVFLSRTGIFWLFFIQF